MSLKYNDNSEIFIGRDENITDVRLNESFGKLIENDIDLSPNNNSEPQIWECRWYSDENVKGYNKGYAVWINTEDELEFLDSKADDMYEYLRRHPYFSNVKEYNKKDASSYQLYHSVLTGYQKEEGTQILQPLFYLGNLSAKAQIRISLKDNNKDTPDTLSSWRDYFIRDTSVLQEELQKFGDYLFENHVKEYHFDGKYINTDQYAEKDFSNVSGVEQYYGNIEDRQLSGFDYIQMNDVSLITAKLDISCYVDEYKYGYKLSVYTYALDTSRVTRDQSELRIRLSKTRNYTTDKIEQAINSLQNNDKMYFVDVKFKMVSATATSESYPYTVPYSQWGLISADNQITAYDAWFNTKQLEKSYRTTTVSSMDYYIQQKEDTYYTEWTEQDTIPRVKDIDYVHATELSSHRTILKHEVNEHDVLICSKLWKSGYLEQTGFVECTPNSNTQVLFKYPYKYQDIGNASFYDIYYIMWNTIYDSYKNLLKDERYVVQLTPLFRGDFDSDDSIEINTLRNDGFSIYNQSNDIKYFMYTVRGFVPEDK